MRYFIELRYDGTAYCGWQRQKSAPSVQQCIEQGLSTLLRCPTEIVGAGRTDTGVHASYYVAHFDAAQPITDTASFAYHLNAVLPRDIAVMSISQVADDAHARFGAVRREYRYRIEPKKNPFTRAHSWQYYVPLDVEAMNEAAARLFDFEDFLKQYSIAVFPLFVWSIWHYRRNIYDEFTIGEFNQTIFTGNFDLNNPQAVISKVRNKVWRKIKALQKRHPDAKESYLQLKAELISLGVTPESAYLYIQGHHLFDKIVLPVVNRVCGILTQIRESEIRRQSKHYTQMNNELSCYRNSTQDTVQMLKKNMGYITSEPFRRIQQDVEHFLSINNSDKASEAGQ